jgi:undecaprenyl-diphosphatase
MNYFEAIILAIVEGITEFLPISSTGHMIIAGEVLGLEVNDFVKTFEVVIQFGAILSVLVLYWRRFLQSFDFYLKLAVSVIPALVIGFFLNDYIDMLLEKVEVVAIALVLGGILMLFVDKWFAKTDEDQTVTYKKGFLIGLAQCVAMIPGVSRSMASIVGGMAQKLNRKTAAEFSFFLAVPTMLAASGYKLLKLIMEPGGVELLQSNLGVLIVGNIVAFIVAMLAIKGFIAFLTKYGFKAFGWYRIVVGGVIIVLLLCGVEMSI